MVPNSHTRRTPWIPWMASAVFWIFVMFLYLGQIWWLSHDRGVRMTGSLWSSFVWQGAFYGLWIPLTVLIWRVTQSWDVSTLGWPQLVLRHFFFGVGISILHSLLVIGVGFSTFGMQNESLATALIGQARGRLYQQVVIYAAIVMTGQAILLYDRWRAREVQAAQLEAQLSAARLESLRAQLHPHFLFNSLHTIASLVRDERNADAVRLISSLGDLLRRVLDSSDQRIPLSDEIDLLSRYLDIQAARFGDRIRVSIDIEPAIRDARVPALLIQPLVENAIRHGLSASPKGGTVIVTARKDGQTIVIAVEDNGAGVDGGWSLDGASGTGLRNLGARLAALYGADGRLQAGPGPAGGFRVRVTMPLQSGLS